MDGRTIGSNINMSGGGVARNIADALGILNVDPLLISAVGNDFFGQYILDETLTHLNCKGVLKMDESNTGLCVVLCDQTGECLVVAADMEIHETISKAHIKNFENQIAGSSLVVLDGNLCQKTTEYVLALCQKFSIPVWFEPTDVKNAAKPFLNKNVSFPKFISPNFLEFKKIFETLFPQHKNNSAKNNYSLIDECIENGYLLSRFIENIIITLGKDGVMVIRRGNSSDSFFEKSDKKVYLRREGEVSHRLYKPDPMNPKHFGNVSGAGDCFASGFIAAMLNGQNETNCVKFGFSCSTASLKSTNTVPLKFFL